MKLLLATLITVASLPAQQTKEPATETTEVKISREAQLELQIIDKREEEADKAIQALVEMMKPYITGARSALAQKLCKEAGFGETETHTCQLDIGKGMIKKVAKPPKQKN